FLWLQEEASPLQNEKSLAQTHSDHPQADTTEIIKTETMLLLKTFISWLFVFSGFSASEISICGTTVDPPANLEITDPGFLGYLTIQWSRPDSLQNLTDCTVRYQLRYYDTYEDRWRSIRTTRLSYAAQFDLEKPVRVKILTVLKCTCTNGTEVQGEETEMVYTTEPTGLAESRIRDFHCIYYEREYMECTWESGSVQPPNSQHSLYYWHRDMNATKECPEYISLSEVRKGCRFPHQTLVEFFQFNMCVNGSSPEGILRTAFFSIEIQNYVKPAVVSSVQVLEGAGFLKLDWVPPAGRVPEHCLDYEVESRTLMANGKELKKRKVLENIGLDTSCEMLEEDKRIKTCFHIRSKMNVYCADRGLWSEWSPAACTKEKETETRVMWDSYKLVLLLITIAGVILFGLSMWILNKICAAQKNKKEVLFKRCKQKTNETLPAILKPVFK
ncbi:hypothetical protein DNTS_024961, partial [Danionella cerebrum]